MMYVTFSTRFDLLHNKVVFTAYFKPNLKQIPFDLLHNKGVFTVYIKANLNVSLLVKFSLQLYVIVT